MSILLYYLAFFLVEFLVILLVLSFNPQIVLLGLLLHAIALHNSYTFYFQNEPLESLFVGLVGYGLFYLLVAMLWTQCMSDQFTIHFVNVMSIILNFVIFATHSPHSYYYFGYNYLLPSVHNFWIAYVGSFLLAALYLLVELWRHSLPFRMRAGKCCKPQPSKVPLRYLDEENEGSSYVESDCFLRLE